LKTTRRDAVWLSTFSRPDGLNTLTMALLDEIGALLRDAASDPACSCLVLAGEGRAFLAGTDLHESIRMDATAFAAFSARAREVTLALSTARVPILAAVNGFAIGAGCEIAMACDFIYAASAAKFALPEAKLGVIPGMGGTYLLARAVGLPRAKEMLFTGETISAEEANLLGLVNKVTPGEELIAQALACAERISARGPLAVRAARDSLVEAHCAALAEALEVEWAHRQHLFRSRDRSEGIRAFLENRTPIFRGL
jgi:enoyl-CoA hydratase